MSQPKYKKHSIQLTGQTEIAVYATPKIADALREVTDDMTLYQGVRLAELFEAVYEQGKKDGARGVFAAIDANLESAKQEIPHRLPGAPPKKKKKKAK